MSDEKKGIEEMPEVDLGSKEAAEAFMNGLGLKGKEDLPRSGRDYADLKAADELLGASTTDSTTNTPSQPNTGNVSAQQDRFIDAESKKEFPDELSYMKWKAGEDGRKHGEAMKELQLQVANLQGQLEQGQQATVNAPSREDLIKRLMPSITETELSDRAVDLMYEGFSNLARDFMGEIEQAKASPQMLQIQETLETNRLREKFGISQVQEEEMLQGDPELSEVVRDLPAARRLAILARARGIRSDAESRVRIQPTVQPGDVVESTSQIASSAISSGSQPDPESLDADALGSLVRGLAKRGVMPDGMRNR